jgi:hypothetical protein
VVIDGPMYVEPSEHWSKRRKLRIPNTVALNGKKGGLRYVGGVVLRKDQRMSKATIMILNSKVGTLR